MRSFIRIILLAACWLSSFGVMAHRADGMFGAMEVPYAVTEQTDGLAPMEVSVQELVDLPRTFHAAVRGDHAENDAHLRSRQQQWRTMRWETSETMLTVRTFRLLQTHHSCFSSNPWTDYTDPHLLYSYRLFLF